MSRRACCLCVLMAMPLSVAPTLSKNATIYARRSWSGIASPQPRNVSAHDRISAGNDGTTTAWVSVKTTTTRILHCPVLSHEYFVNGPSSAMPRQQDTTLVAEHHQRTACQSYCSGQEAACWTSSVSQPTVPPDQASQLLEVPCGHLAACSCNCQNCTSLSNWSMINTDRLAPPPQTRPTSR